MGCMTQPGCVLLSRRFPKVSARIGADRPQSSPEPFEKVSEMHVLPGEPITLKSALDSPRLTTVAFQAVWQTDIFGKS